MLNWNTKYSRISIISIYTEYYFFCVLTTLSTSFMQHSEKHLYAISIHSTKFKDIKSLYIAFYLSKFIVYIRNFNLYLYINLNTLDIICNNNILVYFLKVFSIFNKYITSILKNIAKLFFRLSTRTIFSSKSKSSPKLSTVWFNYSKKIINNYTVNYNGTLFLGYIINSNNLLQNNKFSKNNTVSMLRYSRFFNKTKFSRNRQVVFSIVQFGLFINILFIVLGSSIYYQITADLSYFNVLLYLVSLTQLYFWIVLLSGGLYNGLRYITLPIVNLLKFL